MQFFFHNETCKGNNSTMVFGNVRECSRVTMLVEEPLSVGRKKSLFAMGLGADVQSDKLECAKSMINLNLNKSVEKNSYHDQNISEIDTFVDNLSHEDMLAAHQEVIDVLDPTSIAYLTQYKHLKTEHHVMSDACAKENEKCNKKFSKPKTNDQLDKTNVALEILQLQAHANWMHFDTVENEKLKWWIIYRRVQLN